MPLHPRTPEMHSLADEGYDDVEISDFLRPLGIRVSPEVVGAMLNASHAR